MSSVRSQSKPTGVRAAAAELCLSGWIYLGFPAIRTNCVTDAAILTAAAMLKAGRTPRQHRAALCQLQSFLPPCSTLTASSPAQRHRHASLRVTAAGHGRVFPQRTIMKLSQSALKGKFFPLIPVSHAAPLSPEPPVLLSCWFASYLPGGIGEGVESVQVGARSHLPAEAVVLLRQ